MERVNYIRGTTSLGRSKLGAMCPCGVRVPRLTGTCWCHSEQCWWQNVGSQSWHSLGRADRRHSTTEVRTGNLNLIFFFHFWLQTHSLIWINFKINPCFYAKQRVFKALSSLYSSLVTGNKIFSNRFFWQITLVSFSNQMQSKLLHASSHHVPASCEHTPNSPWTHLSSFCWGPAQLK